MTPNQISKRVVVDRLAWADKMVAEIQADELYDIAVNHLTDVETIAQAYRRWLHQNATYLDETL